MRLNLSALGLLSVVLVLAACDKKLDSADARKLIEEKYYGEEDLAVTCGVQAPPTTQAADGSRVLIDTSDRDTSCVRLMAAGMLVTRWPFCERGSDCVAFKPVAKYDSGVLKFPCGKKSLGEVTSVSTEGNKATVKYKKTVTIDMAVPDALKASCEVAVPKKTGEYEESVEFQRDDAGKWSIKE